MKPAKKKKLKLEVWKCSTNLTERHYFLKKPYRYVLGVNPKVVKPKTLKKILAIIMAEL